MNDGDRDEKAKRLAAKNRRLAIVLALISIGIYVIFVLGYV